MRENVLEEPFSNAAIWSRRLAVFAILVAGIGLVIIRSGAVEITAGLSVFGAAILLACVAILLAGAGAVVIWRTGRKGIGQVVGAVLLSIALLAFPAYLAAKAVQLPLINDVATDVNEPPQFSRSASAQAARKDFVDRTQLTGALEQQRAYADIQPIVIDLEAGEVFKLVQQTIKNLGWRVVEEIPATGEKKERYKSVRQRVRSGGRRRFVVKRVLVSRAQAAKAGRIDAIDRSLIMGFPDDITIRIRPLESQTRIDIRSASRYGRHDFGANAARIRKFGARLQEQLDAR